MRVFPRFTYGDWTTPLKFPDLTFKVNRFSFSSIGGPLAAEIEASGPDASLYMLPNFLRCGVSLYTSQGDYCWSGYLAGLTVSAGGIDFGVGLDGMSNGVSVAYTYASQRFTTGWATDAVSVKEYGTKQKIMTLNDASDDSAEDYRDTMLSVYKLPIPTIVSRQGSGISRAVLSCRGLFDTLKWKYYTRESDRVYYSDTGGVAQALGKTTVPQIAMGFQLPAGAETWNSAVITVRIRTVGSPADAPKLDLYTNVAGAPGVLLSDSTAPGATYSSAFRSISFALSDPVTLVTATTYWIVISRTGSNDNANYFEVEVQVPPTYADGALLLWNGSSWGARSPDADLLFEVDGIRETTAQIATIVTDCGQFLAGSTIVNASGVSAVAYRDGDMLAYDAVLALLGGTATNKRLLCSVGIDRVLSVYEEPALVARDVEVFLDGSGLLVGRDGRKLKPHETPTGKWGMLKQNLPGSLDMSRLADPSHFFIDEAEYTVASSRWSLSRTRGAALPWDFSELS